MNAFVPTLVSSGFTSQTVTPKDTRRPSFASSFVNRVHPVNARAIVSAPKYKRSFRMQQELDDVDQGPIGTEEERKLFVGNLSWGTTEDGLREAFERFGYVRHAKVIMDRDNPSRSRGFGFVEFNDPAHAIVAREEMDGGDIDGRPVRVDKVQKRERSPRPSFD